MESDKNWTCHENAEVTPVLYSARQEVNKGTWVITYSLVVTRQAQWVYAERDVPRARAVDNQLVSLLFIILCTGAVHRQYIVLPVQDPGVALARVAPVGNSPNPHSVPLLFLPIPPTYPVASNTTDTVAPSGLDREGFSF